MYSIKAYDVNWIIENRQKHKWVIKYQKYTSILKKTYLNRNL